MKPLEQNTRTIRRQKNSSQMITLLCNSAAYWISVGVIRRLDALQRGEKTSDEKFFRCCHQPRKVSKKCFFFYIDAGIY